MNNDGWTRKGRASARGTAGRLGSCWARERTKLAADIEQKPLTDGLIMAHRTFRGLSEVMEWVDSADREECLLLRRAIGERLRELGGD